MSKGSIMDVMLIGVALFVLAISITIASTIMTQVQANLGPIMNNSASTAALQGGVDAINTFNYGFLIIFFGLMAGSLIFAFLVPTHPIFIILSIIMLMVSVIVLPILSNAFESFTADTSIAGSTANFPLIMFFMSNLTTILIAMGVLIMIVMYTRWNQGGQE